MAEPKIAGRKPIRVDVEKGKRYAWCSCGESSKQPFCDGSHKGTEFRPKIYLPDQTRTVSLCTCKHTQKGVFCDGSHKNL